MPVCVRHSDTRGIVTCAAMVWFPQGSYSKPCVVHKDFQLIVHMPARVRCAIPFYNRFEKCVRA
jgi:hypothetical protein